MKNAFKSFFAALFIVTMVAACTAKTENTTQQDAVETPTPSDTTASPADTTASPVPADTTNNK